MQNTPVSVTPQLIRPWRAVLLELLEGAPPALETRGLAAFLAGRSVRICDAMVSCLELSRRASKATPRGLAVGYFVTSG